MKDLCRTRWVQRIDAIQVFCSLHQSTVACMESICDDGPRLWSSDYISDASSLLLAISTTDFLSALVITDFCLKYLQALTSNLQAETKDIVAEINNVISTLKNVRDNVDTRVGLVLWRCVKIQEQFLLCHGDVVAKSITVMFLLALHVSTTVVRYPFLCSTIRSPRCGHCLAPINRKLCLVFPLCHRSWSLRHPKSVTPRLVNLLTFIKMTSRLHTVLLCAEGHG